MTATHSVVMCGCGKPAAIIRNETGLCVPCFAGTVNQLFRESSARKQQQIVDFADKQAASVRVTCERHATLLDEKGACSTCAYEKLLDDAWKYCGECGLEVCDPNICIVDDGEDESLDGDL